MKFVYILFMIGLFHFSGMAQQKVSIYKIKSNGAKGQLIQEAFYENNLLRSVKRYNEKRQLDYVISKKYNTKNELIKEVKTSKIGHEYDIVREFYYDSEGRKSGLLGGNNRTGKWYSERYLYNAQGDLDTIFYYQKNGDLISLLVHEYEYDDQNRVAKLVKKSIDTEMDEEVRRSTFTYEYDGANFDKKTTEKDEKGTIVYQEWRKNYTADQPKSIEYTMLDLPKMKTTYFYSNKKLIKKEEYTDNQWSSTVTYKYNGQGKILEEKFKTKNGYNGEIYVY